MINSRSKANASMGVACRDVGGINRFCFDTFRPFRCLGVVLFSSMHFDVFRVRRFDGDITWVGVSNNSLLDVLVMMEPEADAGEPVV